MPHRSVSPSDRLHKRFAFLHDVIDQHPDFGLSRFPTGVWRLGRDLECVAGFEYARRLTLDQKFATTLHDVTRLNPWMGVAYDGHARLYGYVHYYGRVARDRAVNLRQDLGRNPA